MDKKIVAEMDQKVIDQQNTLEKAGVPGFYITTNPQVHQCINIKVATCAEKGSNCCLLLQELTMQMNLLELILKLQQKESQSGIIWNTIFCTVAPESSVFVRPCDIDMARK